MIMGAKVTVVEMLDRIVPVEDAEVSAFLAKALTKQGMDIRAATGVKKITDTGNGRHGRDQGQGWQRHHRRIQPCHRRGRHRARTSRISGWKRWASQPDERFISRPTHVPHQCPRHLGDWRCHPAGPGWRTRPAMRA